MGTFLVEALVTLVVLAGACLLPGLALVRRLRLAPLERLGVAVGASLFVVYLLQGAAFVAGAPRLGALAIVGLVALAGVTARGDLRRLLARARPRRGLLAFAAVLAWVLLNQAVIRHHAGRWGGDWEEHHARAQFFLGGLPLDTQFLGLYSLPARPPLQNVVSSHVLALVGDSYAVFQVTSAFLAVLVVIPCWLLAAQLLRGARPRALVLAALLATTPMVTQNATFTWTKLLACYFLLLATSLYVRAAGRAQATRLRLSVFLLAAGCLVHYSVAPYALVLALHHALTTAPRWRTAWREWGVLAAIGAGTLGTWFGPAILTYGVSSTFGANTTVTGFQGADGHLAVALDHVVRTLVPFPLRDPRPLIPQDYLPGLVSDYAFLLYQPCLPLMPGLAAGALALALAARALRTAAAGPRRLWLAWLIGGGLLAVASHPPVIPFAGVGHVVLQPVALVAVTFLAAALPRTAASARAALVGGRVVDVALGIVLHALVQSLTVDVVWAADGVRYADPYGLSRPALMNVIAKGAGPGARVYVGDLLASGLDALRAAVVAGGVVWLLLLARASSTMPRAPARPPAARPPPAAS